jgi:hypothetical protein
LIILDNDLLTMFFIITAWNEIVFFEHLCSPFMPIPSVGQSSFSHEKNNFGIPGYPSFVLFWHIQIECTILLWLLTRSSSSTELIRQVRGSVSRAGTMWVTAWKSKGF